MKLSVLFLTLVLSSASFGATILNGVELAGLPTATKFYSKVAKSTSEVESLKAEMKEACNADKTNTADYLTRTGNKIMATQGCEVRTSQETYCDQGGCAEGINLSTGFSVTFK